MYHLLLPAVADLLTATGAFGAVVCGTGKGTAYPLANVILRHGLPSKDQLTEQVALMVQVQSYEGDDSETAYLATLALLSTARAALHGQRVAGKGARQLLVKSVESAQIRETGEMIYYLPVEVMIDPAGFTTP